MGHSENGERRGAGGKRESETRRRRVLIGRKIQNLAGREKEPAGTTTGETARVGGSPPEREIEGIGNHQQSRHDQLSGHEAEVMASSGESEPAAGCTVKQRRP